MQPSNSEKTFSESRKLQKSRGIKKNENTNSEIKNVITSDKKNNEEYSVPVVNYKDFPELKSSVKPRTKQNEGMCSSGSRGVKTWSSAVSGQNKNNSKEAFPALSGFENSHRKNLNSRVEKSNEGDSVSENNTSDSPNIKSEVLVDKAKDSSVCSKASKVDSPKKSSVQPQKSSLKKKRKDPVVINFQDILTIKKNMRKSRQHNIIKNRVQKHKVKEILSGNILDSSNPQRSRGKQREFKKKKLSKIKTTILKERILKQKIKEKTVDGNLENECFNIMSETDFKNEIKAYLCKLSERKLRNEESSKNKLENLENTNEGNKENENKICKNEKNKKTSGKKKQIPQIGPGNEIKFSSKFREYCDNIITPELNTSVTELIKGVVELQDRLFLRDPIKAKAKKRHVSGIREVKKYLNLKKIKMIIIAPNLEKLQMEGSVYDSIEELKSLASGLNVPYGFALDRYALGICTRKKVLVSAFGILNYEGLESLYEEALYQLLEAKREFLELAAPKKDETKEKTDDATLGLISRLVSVFREDLKLSSEN